MLGDIHGLDDQMLTYVIVPFFVIFSVVSSKFALFKPQPQNQNTIYKHNCVNGKQSKQDACDISALGVFLPCLFWGDI